MYYLGLVYKQELLIENTVLVKPLRKYYNINMKGTDYLDILKYLRIKEVILQKEINLLL